MSNIYIQFFLAISLNRDLQILKRARLKRGKEVCVSVNQRDMAGKRDSSYSGGKKLSKLMYSTTELQDTKKCLRHQGLLDSYPVPILISPLMEESRGRLPS